MLFKCKCRYDSHIKIKAHFTSFTPFNRDFISSSANNLLPSKECIVSYMKQRNATGDKD